MSWFDYFSDEEKKYLCDIALCSMLKPNDAKAYNNRGRAYHHLKCYEQAIDDYNKALQLMELPVIYNNRGQAYYYLKNYKQAFADLNKSIELGIRGKDLVEALDYLELCYKELRNNEKSQSDFAKDKQIDYKGWFNG